MRSPPASKSLADLATDLRWTWSHESDALWRAMDPEVWEQTKNPYVVLQYLTEERLAELAADPGFKDHLRRLDGGAAGISFPARLVRREPWRTGG